LLRLRPLLCKAHLLFLRSLPCHSIIRG
jgi:hypothetical protein